MPGVAHLEVERAERGEVAGHAIVSVVSSEHAREPRVLLAWRLVASLANLLTQRRKFGGSLLPRGATYEAAHAIATSGHDVRESEEVERRRPRVAVEMTVSE